MVVMHVHRSNAVTQRSDRLHHALIDVRMSYVEANSHIGQMTHLQDGHEMLRRCRIAKQILDQKTYSQGARKRAEMFKGRLRIFHRPWRPPVLSLAQMHHKVLERDKLRSF